MTKLAKCWTDLEIKLDHLWTTQPDDFKPLLKNRNPDPAYLRQVSHVKRLLEWWTADDKFRKAFETQGQALADQLGLEVDVEEIRSLYDNDCANRFIRTNTPLPIPAARYRVWNAEKYLDRELVRVLSASSSDPRHATWRDRQIARVLGQLGEGPHTSIVHAPFAIELSEGCSVGCWFCGVSAEKRKSDFLYTEQNARLWQECLEILREVIGPAAGQGFCYWATDPLDNPDYEKFCVDFSRILGRFPQTTTAQAHKHIDRVRKLLKLSRSSGGIIDRFSVLTLAHFKILVDAFTPEELLYTEFVTQNMEASSMQSNSGRARKSARIKKKAEFNGYEPAFWDEVPGTIACVSGFLINMVKKTVRLITPVPCDDRWPNGYWIFEEGTFTDALSFRDLTSGMIERHMPTSLRASTPVRLRRDIRLSLTKTGCKLSDYGSSTEFPAGEGFEYICQALKEGGVTAGEIAVRAEDDYGIPASRAMDILNDFLSRGFLDEEPDAPEPEAPGLVAAATEMEGALVPA